MADAKVLGDQLVDYPEWTNRPLFYVQATQEFSVLGGAAVYTIKFASEIVDQGGVFNTGTFTFTAPVHGYYLFSLTACAQMVGTAHSYGQLKFNASTHGREIWSANLENLASPASDDLVQPVTWVSEMDNAETATLTWQVSGGSTDSHLISSSVNLTRWSGFLLSAL